MKTKWKNLIVCILIPLAIGGLSALLTQNSADVFERLNKPMLSPPGWLFPVVRTILYILMGIASYLILTSGKPSGKALTTYGFQLLFNFFWSIFFFRPGLCLPAFLWLVLLWLLVLKTLLLFLQISRPAGYLMLPYLLWVTYAEYLNLSICLLN